MSRVQERWLETMVRCHAVPILSSESPDNEKKTEPARRRRARSRRPSIMHVLDVETATEHTRTMPGFDGPEWEPSAQALLFGRGHTYVRDGRRWTLTDEWLFYPDSLPAEGVAR